jgi:hypothetical protein
VEKIPTMYPRDEAKKGHPVMPGVKLECAWAEAGEGVATRKLDGTNVKIEAGKLLKRQKPKSGVYDEAAYAEAMRGDPGDKYIWEAFDALPSKLDGIYEAVGPKIQGNPEGYESHTLVRVVPAADELAIPVDHLVRTFEGLKAFLADRNYEGIVFHHPDGRFAKIKRRDFGIPWPAPRKSE